MFEAPELCFSKLAWWVLTFQRDFIDIILKWNTLWKSAFSQLIPKFSLKLWIDSNARIVAPCLAQHSLPVSPELKCPAPPWLGPLKYHVEFAKENLHILSGKKTKVLCALNGSIWSLDIILIPLPDFAFPILKLTQSTEFNSPIINK